MPDGSVPGGALRGLLSRRRAEPPRDPARAVAGPVRKGRRTKDLVKKLEVGEIALVPCESWAALEVSVRLRYIAPLDAAFEDRSQKIIGTLYRLAHSHSR